MPNKTPHSKKQIAKVQKKASEGNSKVDISDDASGGKEQTFNPADLVAIDRRVIEMMELEDRLEVMAIEAKELAEKAFLLKTQTIPELMEKVGLKDFKITNGARMEIAPLIRASLPSAGAIEKESDPDRNATLRDRFNRGIKWLETHGVGALVKTEVKASLGKGADKLAQKAIFNLKKLGIEAVALKGVHPGALTSYVKECLAQGKEIDMDLFAVFSGKQAVVERPKVLPGASTAATSSSGAPSGASKKHTGDRSLF